MKKPCFSILAVISMILIPCLLSTSCAVRTTDPAIDTQYPVDGHPAIEILRQYQSVDSRVNIVNPYIVNLMALDLLNDTSFRNLVRAYIGWYLDHLNYPDKYGATGSIYDYRVFADGREESLDSMDSVDSYAATFIMLVYRYYKMSGDRDLILDFRQQLEDIIYLVPYLQQSDGLTVALPGTTGKYLMDNCEAYGGVSDFADLATEFGWDIRTFYLERKNILRLAIANHLYNSGTGYYSWLKDGDIVHPSDWTRFYPDAFAQLFPILYDITNSNSRKIQLWQRFHQNHESIVDSLPVEQKIIYRWTAEEMEKLNGQNLKQKQYLKQKQNLNQKTTEKGK